MDNFETRYLAIVEKNAELKYPIIQFSIQNLFDSDGNRLPAQIGNNAMCWWLERQAIKHFGGPREYWDFIVRFIGFGCYTVDPSGAVLTTWEIILRIKR